MTIKVFVSGICGSHDVRKTQQRVLFILSTLPVDLEIIDVTEPGREQERALMQEEVRKHNKKDILPPQIFNGDQYCGNYDDFQLAADDDVLMSFLKLEETPSKSEPLNNSTEVKNSSVIQNGVSHDDNISDNQHQVEEQHKDTEVMQTGEENVIDVDQEISLAEPISEMPKTNEKLNVVDVEEGRNENDSSIIEEIKQDLEPAREEEPVKESSEEESSEEEESD